MFGQQVKILSIYTIIKFNIKLMTLPLKLIIFFCSDGKSFYIVGVDGEVKEARNDIIIRNLKIIGIKLDNIILAHSDMMLFVTGGKGTIVSIQFPLLDKAVFSEFHMHNKNVTAIALSYDDQTIISVSEDATMCIWKLDNSEGKAIVLSPDFHYSEEILINKNNLQEKLTNIKVKFFNC